MKNENRHDVPRVGLASLGCPKALVDSELIVTRLRAEGYDLSSSYDDADIVVVNTCGFIEAAKPEDYSIVKKILCGQWPRYVYII